METVNLFNGSVLMISRSRKSEPGVFSGSASHFSIYSKTADAVLRSFCIWAEKGNTEFFIAELNALRDGIL